MYPFPSQWDGAGGVDDLCALFFGIPGRTMETMAEGEVVPKVVGDELRTRGRIVDQPRRVAKLGTLGGQIDD